MSPLAPSPHTVEKRNPTELEGATNSLTYFDMAYGLPCHRLQADDDAYITRTFFSSATSKTFLVYSTLVCQY